jgi:hypothetical protein
MRRGRYSSLAALAGALALAALGVTLALADPPETKGLPAGWEAAAIGTDDQQSVSVENGLSIIRAGGSGLVDDADSGVGIYRKHAGNGSVVVRLLTQGGSNDARTAVVFRQGLAPGARVVRLSYSNGHQLVPEVRKEADAFLSLPGQGVATMVGILGYFGPGSDTLPGAGRAIGSGIWIGIDRNGDKFTYYWSEDGKVWVPIAATVIHNPDDPFPAEALVGIEASSHEAGKTATSTLDNLTISNELLGPRAVSGVAYLPRDRSVIVTWNPVAVADGDVTYNVYRINQTASERAKVNQEPIKASSFMVEGLNNGEAYRFGVTAVLNNVESPLALPFPTQDGRSFGIAVPAPAAPGGLQLYNIGTNDVGTVTVTGEGASARYHFKVGGWDFWEAGDGGALLAMPLEGDLEVSLRLLEGPTDHGDGWAQGGPTFRETLDTGSRMAIAVISAANAMQFKRRRVEFQRPVNSESNRDDNTVRPVSARLVRKGDTFSAFYSEDDGKIWQPMGDPNMDTLQGFAKMPYVGMTWSAHQEGFIADVAVDNFVIKPAQ